MTRVLRGAADLAETGAAPQERKRIFPDRLLFSVRRTHGRETTPRLPTTTFGDEPRSADAATRQERHRIGDDALEADREGEASEAVPGGAALSRRLRTRRHVLDRDTRPLGSSRDRPASPVSRLASASGVRASVGTVWTSLERRPVLVDALAAVVAFVFFGALDLLRTGPETLPVDALFALATAFRRRSPGIGLGIAWVGALVQLVVLPSFINGNVLIAVVIFATSLAEKPVVRRLGLVSSVVGGVIASVKLVLITGDFVPSNQEGAKFALSQVIYFVGVSGVIAAALSLFWLLGAVTRVRRAYVTERLERLESEQDLLRAELRVAQQTERTRITREMHDAIGHSLAVIIAQSDGARYAVAKNPQAATEALGVINRSARSALDDVSQLLSVLQEAGDHQSSLGVADLEGLVATMTSSGLDVTLRETGERLALSTSNDLALYRVAQESLTNALKHGGSGTRVTIDLDWTPEAVTLASRTVETDGPGLVAPSGQRSPDGQDSPTRIGYGVAGMTERVRLVGGTVRAGRRTDGVHGYEVLVRIPHTPGGTE
jgi:signal transduction histidine kinase